MDIRRFDALPRSLGVETPRRRFVTLAATAAFGDTLLRPGDLAAEDRPAQKRLAKMSVLERGAAWIEAQQLSVGAYPSGVALVERIAASWDAAAAR